MINVRVPFEVRWQLATLAKKRMTTESAIIREALLAWFEKQGLTLERIEVKPTASKIHPN
jgi:predicted transcriptional regulator